MSVIIYFCVWRSWITNKIIALLTTSFRYGSYELTKIFFDVQSCRDVESMVCVFCGTVQDSRVNSASFCYLLFITAKYVIKFWDCLGRNESCHLTYSDYSLFFVSLLLTNSQLKTLFEVSLRFYGFGDLEVTKCHYFLS